MIKRENWKGRYVWVARENGKISAWKNYKNSNLNKESASRIYKYNKTFNPNIKKSRESLTNFNEITISSKSNIKNRKGSAISRRPSHEIVQYFVSGNYKGQQVVARSEKVSNINSRQAKDNAWTSFLERIAQIGNKEYDADEGLALIDDVTNIQEGWVYYVKKNNRS